MSLVLPAPALNYLGQGALAAGAPREAGEPVLPACAAWAPVPMVILATTRDHRCEPKRSSPARSRSRGRPSARPLAPRFEVRCTSRNRSGPDRHPAIDWLLLFAVVLLVPAVQARRAPWPARLRYRGVRQHGRHRVCSRSLCVMGSLGLAVRPVLNRDRPFWPTISSLRREHRSIFSRATGSPFRSPAGASCPDADPWCKGSRAPTREDPQGASALTELDQAAERVRRTGNGNGHLPDRRSRMFRLPPCTT